MGNGFSSRKRSCPTYGICLILLKSKVLASWQDGLGNLYTCADVAGGVGHDSTASCDEALVCAANTYVNVNSKCACLQNGVLGHSGNSYVSTGPSNVNFATASDTCVNCQIIATNTDTYNTYAASNFRDPTSSGTSCACIDPSLRPNTNGLCKCPSGSALTSNDPKNGDTNFACVQCSDLTGNGPGEVANACGCTGSCNDDSACTINAIVDSVLTPFNARLTFTQELKHQFNTSGPLLFSSQNTSVQHTCQFNTQATNTCECIKDYAETTTKTCLACTSLLAYNLASNPLANQNSDSAAVCLQSGFSK